MTTGCSAIIIIILLVAGVMARRGKTGLAIAILPMCITPFFYLISGYLAGFINRWQTTEIYFISRAVIVVVAALLACLIMGFFASKVRSGAARKSYLVLCGGFTLLLTVVILARTLPIL